MYCRVCGTEENVMYAYDKRQALCETCEATTPRKVSRVAFDKVYWRGDNDVPESTKREFYSDYLTSNCNLAKYIDETVTYIGD